MKETPSTPSTSDDPHDQIVPEPIRRQLLAHDLRAAGFTRVVAETIRRAMPEMEVEIARDLELIVRKPGSQASSRMSLVNTWELCRAEREERVSVVAHHVGNVVRMCRMLAEPLALPKREAIVPMVKNDAFVRRASENFRGTDVLSAERLVGDVWVAYAVDLPGSLAFLTESQRTALDIPKAELRSIAAENLRRIAPAIARIGEAPHFMLAAGGTWEASLLVLDEVWEEQAKVVDGELVVAVPTRAVIMFTGSNCKEVVEALRKTARDVMAAGPYPVSQCLLVRRNRQWELFDRPVQKGPMN